MKSATEQARESLQSKQKSAYVLQLEQELMNVEGLIFSINGTLEQLRDSEVLGRQSDHRSDVIAGLVKTQEEAHKLRVEIRQSLEVFK